MRSLVVAAALASLSLAMIPLVAQEPGPAKRPAGKGSDPTRRMPPYFAQVGLSAEQREEIYQIRGKHLKRIEALQQQIEEHEAQMLAECETVLTDAQRRLLEQRRAAAAANKEKAKTKAKAKSKDRASDQPNGPASKSVK